MSHKFNKFVVRGSFGSSPEIWSNTLHFMTEFTAHPDVLPGDWDEGAVTSAVTAFYGSSHFSTTCKVDGWRGYQCDDMGRLIGNNMKRVDYTASTQGAGTNRYPPQVALVMSLHANDRGLGQRGRVYLPGIVTTIDDNTYLVSVANCTTFLGDFRTYIEALKDAMFPSTVSGEALLNVGGKGSAQVGQAVTEYRMGRALDTLRTRRNKLLEEYEVLSA